MLKNLLFKKFLVLFVFVGMQFPALSQDWTWVKGDNTINMSGVYGTPYNAFGANNPGSRNGAASWTDNSGYLWLFGGDGQATAGSSGRLNDLWKYNTSTNVWTWVSGSNYSNQAGIYGTLGITSSTNCPGSRAYAVTWKDASGNLWLFGGEGYDVNGSFTNLNDLWKFDVNTLRWSWVSGANTINQYGIYGTQGVTASSNVPGARRISQGWADNSGNLWLFGGYGKDISGNEYMLNDLWKYNIATSQWTWMTGDTLINHHANFGTLGVASSSNTPGARHGATTWKDNSGNFWLCNGYGNDSTNAGFLSDVWKYNLTSGQWTWMAGSYTVNQVSAGVQGITSATATPGGRYISSSWTDSNGNLYLWGGNGVSGNYGDLWKYSIGTSQWTWLRGNTSIQPTYGTQGAGTTITEPGAGYYRSAWKDLSNNLWLFGGVGYDTYAAFSDLDEMWKTSIPATAPTASFSFNQTLNVCQGSRIALIDQSTNAPASYNYYLDGALWTYSANPVLTNGTVVPISSGIHTVSLIVSNAVGSSSAFTRTINISSLAASTITRTPGGSTAINIGSGSTPNSSWSPWVYSFSDPIPSGATITRVDMSYYGQDQGWGGTGATAVMTLADQNVSSAVFLHSTQYYSTSVTGSIYRYVYGGTNYLKMYFVGWSGWQGFINNATLTLYYERYNISVCAGGTVALTAAGGAARVWSGGVIEGVAFTPTASAIYTVTSTELNGCQNTNTVSVTIDSPTISVYQGQICNGNSFTIVPNGASTYTFSGGTNVVSPTVNTTYSVTGTSSLGCPASNTGVVTVTVSPNPTITLNSGNLCTGKIFTLSPSGALTYTLSTPDNTVSPTVTSTYFATGTSSVGCVSTAAGSTVTVLPLPNISVSNATICPGAIFTIAPSGASTYTYSSGSNTVSPSTLTSYSVTGTDVNGCVSSSMAVLSVSVNPATTISATSGTICVGNSFSIVPSGAVTYTFSGGSALVSPAITSTYAVTGTSSLGCVSQSAAVSSVTVYTLPTITANSGAICSGNSYTINPSGAVSYTFLNGSSVVSPASSTSYSIIGRNALGCVSSSPGVATVTVNPLPVLSISGPSAVCSGAAISQTVSGANTYSWSTGSTSNVISVNPTVVTVYNVSGTNTATGCFNSASKVVSVGNPPVISVNGGNVCAGNVFTIQPTGAFTYTYSNGSSTVLATVSPTANTSYFVSGTSSLGCVSTSSAICNVIVNAPPAITVNSGGVCAGSVFSMTPTGASTYTFSNGTSTVIPSANASYTVTGTSILGCVSIVPAIANVTVNALPVISVTNATVCTGSSFSLSPSGASTYTFMTSAGQSPAWVTPLVTTNYSVTGTSSAGCVSPNAAVLTLSTIALPTISVNSGTVCSGSAFTMTPYGASTYTYSSGASTVIPLSNTSYSVRGTSSAGCVSALAAVASVTVLAVPVVTVSNGVICAGQVYTIVPGGAYSYTFSSGSATVAPSTNTLYTVVGSSSLGCQSSNVAMCNVVVNTSPTLSVLGTSVICDGQSTSLLASGATTYTWNNTINGQIQNFSPSVTTVYTVSGINSSSCVGTSTIQIVVHSLPTITLNSGTICPSSPFVIVPSGANSYTFSSGTSTVSPSVTSSYSVMGTDANGCVSGMPSVTTITVTNNVHVSASGSSVICAGNTATLSASGASSYTWNTGAFTSSIAATPSTSAVYTVMGSTGTCGDTAYISVHVNALPVLLVGSSSSLMCVGETATLTSSGASTYLWNDGETITAIVINPTVTTSYTVTGVDANGCSNKTSFTQSVSACLGISSQQSNVAFINVYPNPNTGEFTVETPQPITMVIVNALGQQVLQQQLSEGKNRIMLDNQVKGIYFIEFKNDQQSKTVRIIKQ